MYCILILKLMKIKVKEKNNMFVLYYTKLSALENVIIITLLLVPFLKYVVIWRLNIFICFMAPLIAHNTVNIATK